MYLNIFPSMVSVKNTVMGFQINITGVNKVDFHQWDFMNLHAKGLIYINGNCLLHYFFIKIPLMGI
jgi:hypothetical protein